MKNRLVVLVGVMACFGACLWQMTGMISPGIELAKDVKSPVFMKTEFGTFNLCAPPTALTDLSEAYRQLKSIPDSQGRVPHLLQFDGPISRSHQEIIEEMGGTAYGFLPNNVLMVMAPRELSDLLGTVNGVNMVRERPPWMSLDPYLMKSFQGMADDDVVRLIVSGRKDKDVRNVLEDYGLEIDKDSSPIAISGEVGDLKKRIIPMLLKHPDIAYVGRYATIPVM